MKLSTKDIISLHQAFQSFDGLNEVKEGRHIRIPYKLKANVMMAVARNISRLEEIVDAFSKTRDGLIYAYSDLSGTLKPENAAKFQTEVRGLLELKNDIELMPITVEDLQLEVNAIPVTTLAALVPLLGDEMKA